MSVDSTCVLQIDSEVSDDLRLMMVASAAARDVALKQDDRGGWGFGDAVWRGSGHDEPQSLLASFGLNAAVRDHLMASTFMSTTLRR